MFTYFVSQDVFFFCNGGHAIILFLSTLHHVHELSNANALCRVY